MSDNEHLVKECLGVYVNYDTRIGRHLSDYAEIRGQMVHLKVLSEYYSRKFNDFETKYINNPDPSRDVEEDDIFPITGTFYNIVMSYCRCFDTSKVKNGKESRRSIKLHEKFLGNVDESILETHRMLLDMRNEIIAHAGVSKFERYNYKIGIGEEGQPEILPADDNEQLLSSPYVEINRMKFLLEAVIQKVDTKIDGLLIEAQNELNTIQLNRSLFINKLYNKESITQKDLPSHRK